jgi:hypothetical protein
MCIGIATFEMLHDNDIRLDDLITLTAMSAEFLAKYDSCVKN